MEKIIDGRRKFIKGIGGAAAVCLFSSMLPKVSKAQGEKTVWIEKQNMYSEIKNKMFNQKKEYKQRIAFRTVLGGQKELATLVGEINKTSKKDNISFMGAKINFREKNGFINDGFLYYELIPSGISGNTVSDENTQTALKLIIDYTNAERKKINLQRGNENLKMLETDQRLVQVSLSHSGDMASNNYMSHYNLRNDGPTARATRLGYDFGKVNNKYEERIAENVGAISTGDGILDNPDSVAFAFVNRWMNSPEHMPNIVNSMHAKMGAGIAGGPLIYYVDQVTLMASYDGKRYYATQEFIK